MNQAYNHGSQGNFFGQALKADKTSDASSTKVVLNTSEGESLRVAARDGDLAKLNELLLQYAGRADIIDEQDAIGTTALMTAASNSHKDCVEALLQYGANKTIKNCVS